MFNQITIIGRLTRDPESKTTNSGKEVARFSVAVDNWGKDRGASFFDVDCWGATAQFAVNYLGKGRLVCVTGRMESRKHEDKTYWNITANEVKVLDRPQDDGAGNESTKGQADGRTNAKNSSGTSSQTTTQTVDECPWCATTPCTC